MAKYAKLLLGCYRMGDANDPEVYTAAIIAILSDYPESIIREVVDPRVGLPSKVQWLPTPKEVKEACDSLHRHARWLQERDEAIAAQLAERRRIEEVRQLPARRETWEETKADLERRGFTFGRKKKPDFPVDEFLTKHGVSRQQWDAIPDLPPDFELTATRQAAE